MDEAVRKFAAALPQIKQGLPATGAAAELSFEDLDKVLVLAQSRPTVDLGEDEELIAKLRATKPVETAYFTNRTSPATLCTTHVLINPDGPEAADRLERYREALVKCRDKFEFYEQCHRLKCTAEGDEKADRNHEMVVMIDAVLSRG